jgi:hypothetical protein
MGAFDGLEEVFITGPGGLMKSKVKLADRNSGTVHRVSSKDAFAS